MILEIELDLQLIIQIGGNMKKIIIFSLIFIIFFVNQKIVNADTEFYTNINGIEMTQQEYNNLLSMAFTEQDIYLMTQEEFENNKNNIGIKTVAKVSYIKTVAISKSNNILPKLNTLSLNNDEIVYKNYYLTENQMKKELYLDSVLTNINSSSIYRASNSTIETTYKKLTASITSYLGDGGFMYYRSRADLKWLKMPKITSEDLISVKVTDGFMSDPNTRYGVQIAGDDGDIETVTYGKNSSKWEPKDYINGPKENEEILKPNLINGLGINERRIYIYFDAYQYYPDNYDYFRAQAGYNHNTLTGFDGWIITTADMNI